MLFIALWEGKRGENMDKKFYKEIERGKNVPVKKNKKSGSEGMKKRYIKDGQLCKVTFMLPKEAARHVKQVNVAGDFNNWDNTATPLKRNRTGTFSVTLSLDCGRSYRFKYLIDGSRWENDWYADNYVPNQYGGEDSVVSL